MALSLQSSLRLGVISVAAVLLASSAHGETTVPVASPSSSASTASPPQTVLDVLQQMSAQADVIFAGQVLSVRLPASGGATVVEIQFRVDEAVLGCTVGVPYVLREWAGLWARDGQRYRVGQRLLMLLHAPSAAGMSSPVGGLDGALPIRQGGTVSLDANSPPPPPFVDLRWLGAKLPRAVSYRAVSPHAARAAGRSSVMVSGASVGATSTAPVLVPAIGGDASGGSSVPAQQASVGTVIGMLTSWQRAQHVAP
ncbi:hypothetical protein [Granulicella sp. L60]|uniref:hypothetical protein n=1 Tax=Granulicella sp. L60 TaxID=1641866 RepID=UPI00131A84F7|nr:hypothetical protein [Granulicella sp. L60]